MSDIKSASVFGKNKKVNLSYYDKGGTRYRFSTGMSDTKRNRQVTERDKFRLAQEHYEKNCPSTAKTLYKELALEALRTTSKTRSKEAQNDYEALLEKNILPFLGNMEIGMIRATDIEKCADLLVDANYSQSRIDKNWGVLRMTFQYFFKAGFIEVSPVERADKPKSIREKTDSSCKFYPPSDVVRIVSGATGWFKHYLMTVFQTGIRTSEGLALQWDNIDFEQRKITIKYSVLKGKLKSTKTGIVRVIEMSQVLYDSLQIHYENRLDSPFVFPSPKTLKAFVGTNSLVRSHLKPLLKRLGIEYRTLYATRHSFATNLITTGVPINQVQRLLGHTQITTTMNYVKNGLADSDEIRSKLDKMYSA